MKLLLDTQVLVWLTEADERLGGNARELVNDASNTLHLSYFSLFEIAIKASIGKISYDNSVIDDLPVMGIDLIMPDRLFLGAYKVYSLENKDPFDNTLMTVAIAEKCALLTSDSKILAVAETGLKLIDARR